MSAYRFPVYLLGLPGDALSRLYTITSWCVVRAGTEAVGRDSKAAETNYNKLIQLGVKANGAATKWVDAGANDRYVILGQLEMNEGSGSVENYMQQYRVAKTWIDKMTTRFGSSSFVSIASKLIWEQIQQLSDAVPASLQYRQFATLCAVNCAIGDKKVPFRVTRDFIRAASIGFKSGKGYFDSNGKISPHGSSELKKCHSDLSFPTVQQVRDDLDQLETQGLIGRLVISRRATAYFRPDVCPRKDALAWLAKAGARQQSTGKLRNEERKILETARKNHSEPFSNH